MCSIDINNVSSSEGREKHLGNLSLLEGLEELLIRDKTTKSNIKWGTDNYLTVDSSYTPETEIKDEDLNRVVILPRVMKSSAEQLARTRDKAEVFTPRWVCALQNNSIDEAWFEGDCPFCSVTDSQIEVNHEKILFPEGKSWRDYVEDIRLEITCGEAPYLFTRYDVVSGNIIPVADRTGLLDRKLRVVSENCDAEEEWSQWARRSLESVYGYDFQGDNVFLARMNMLLDYAEHMEAKWGHLPDKKTLRELCTVATWNIWQMDGINYSVPFSEAEKVVVQEDLFGMSEEIIEKTSPVYCRIYDWKANKSIEFKSLIH